MASACVAAFPRVYSLTNITVSVPSTNPNNNSTWDVGGGAPDIFLGNSMGVPFTTAVADSFNASFAGPFDVQLVAGATLRIDAWDEDATVDDFVMACQAMPVSASLLRARSFHCATAGMSMTSSINPK